MSEIGPESESRARISPQRAQRTRRTALTSAKGRLNRCRGHAFPKEGDWGDWEECGVRSAECGVNGKGRPRRGTGNRGTGTKGGGLGNGGHCRMQIADCRLQNSGGTATAGEGGTGPANGEDVAQLAPDGSRGSPFHFGVRSAEWTATATASHARPPGGTGRGTQAGLRAIQSRVARTQCGCPQTSGRPTPPSCIKSNVRLFAAWSLRISNTATGNCHCPEEHLPRPGSVSSRRMGRPLRRSASSGRFPSSADLAVTVPPRTSSRCSVGEGKRPSKRNRGTVGPKLTVMGHLRLPQANCPSHSDMTALPVRAAKAECPPPPTYGDGATAEGPLGAACRSAFSALMYPSFIHLLRT